MRWGRAAAGAMAVAAGLGAVGGWPAGPRLQAQAQAPPVASFTVTETAGIRRTEYPVSVRVPLAKGAVPDPARIRLRTDGADVVAQVTPQGQWDDGSVRALDVDFNTSLAVSERRQFRLEAADGPPDARPRSALTVVESDDTIAVGAVKLGRRAWPLLASVGYRGEIIGSGGNGVSLVDADGAAHPFGADGGARAEILKRGPLLVAVRYTGRVSLADGVAVPVTLTCELPNSKSWIKLTIAVDDRARQVKAIRFETPFALAAFPWTWDFGTDSGTYGAFRSPQDRVVLTQWNLPAAKRWTVETGSGAEVRPYEQSVPGRTPTVRGWGHLVDARNAVAFAVDRFAAAPGTFQWRLDGEGRLAYEAAPAAAPGGAREVVLYEHFVGTPVAIGAATSPAAMVQPPVVSTPR